MAQRWNDSVMFTIIRSLWAMTRRQTHAVTIGGWTPGIRRLTGQHRLECGCCAGVYELVCGDVVEIIDVAHIRCPCHDPNQFVVRANVLASAETLQALGRRVPEINLNDA